MIKISVCYSNKLNSEFASCSIGDMEIDAALLEKPAELRDRIAAAYQVCEDMVTAQLGTAANPRPGQASQPIPPPPRPAPAAPAPARDAGNGQAYGPPKTARTFNGWLAKQDASLANRAAELAREWKLPWKFLEWSDADIQHLYRVLTEPSANGVH